MIQVTQDWLEKSASPQTAPSWNSDTARGCFSLPDWRFEGRASQLGRVACYNPCALPVLPPLQRAMC
jgi:hypothetical protein